MRTCNKCNIFGEFRKKKTRNGSYVEISICWDCERKQKNDAESKRYKKLNKEQKYKHNQLAKTGRKKKVISNGDVFGKKKREKHDLNYLLKRRIGALLRNTISKKCQSTFDILGYSSDDLAKHIEGLFEPWMNWNNWGVYNPNTWDDSDSGTWTWQIDHIKPISFF